MKIFNNIMRSSQFVKQYLPTPSEKQINAYIYELSDREHRDDEYQRILHQWEKYVKEERQLDEKPLEFMKVKPRRGPGVMATNLCEVCYDELPWRKKWCRICGCYCCDKCITRIRKLPQFADPAPFCQKCDRNYMEGMLALQYFEGLSLRQTAFGVLGHEQQLIESLLQIERHKVIAIEEETGKKNMLIEYGNRVIELRSQNRSLQSEINESQKKIEWGGDIHQQLIKKLRRTKKAYKQSFSASINQDSDVIAPPEADQTSTISVENLNQSLLNSMFENEEEQRSQIDGKKCECRLM